MPQITFIERSGATRLVHATEGESLMVAARRAGVEGILGDCGGSAMCGTCHCYAQPGVDLPPPDMLEADAVEFIAANPGPGSRLACQITASPALDGLVLQVAPR